MDYDSLFHEREAELTPARRRALKVLFGRGSLSLRIRCTTTSSSIQWQSADWLIDNGLAVFVFSASGEFIEGTSLGRTFAEWLKSRKPAGLPRGVCSVCGRDVAVRRNGTTHKHRPDGLWCPGSGLPPEDR